MRYHYTVKTYTELAEWAAKAARGELHSLLCFGRAGQGKSETFLRALDDTYHIVIKGRLSARNLYDRLAADKGATFLFDDTRSMLKDDEKINLLMQLAENKKVKTVQWNTTGKKKNGGDDDDEDGSNSFETTSPMVMLINKVDTNSEALDPILSRSILILFQPSAAEVHEYVGKWYPKDKQTKDIYNFIGAHLNYLPYVDIRDYTKSKTVYDMNWKDMLLQSWSADEDMVAVLKVVNDLSIRPGDEYEAAVKIKPSMSRATYYRRLEEVDDEVKNRKQGRKVRGRTVKV